MKYKKGDYVSIFYSVKDDDKMEWVGDARVISKSGTGYKVRLIDLNGDRQTTTVDEYMMKPSTRKEFHDSDIAARKVHNEY